MTGAVAVTAAALALAGPSAAARQSAYDVAVAIAGDGPRPAASAAERRAHVHMRERFAGAELAVEVQRFQVPGRGRSRNVIGRLDARSSCLRIVMAHTDTTPNAPGANDNASGLGVLAELAPRLRALPPGCDVWLVATGAEERLYTGQPDHLGASRLVRRVRRLDRERDLRIALSLDEVGRGRSFHLRSDARRVRSRVEAPVLRAVRREGGSATWVRDEGTGNSDHREFQLAGFPAAKLGQPDNPCRHSPCDRARLLEPRTFPLVRRAVERLLRAR